MLNKYGTILYDRIVGKDIAKEHNIFYWREKIYASIAMGLLFLGIFALIVSVIACIPEKLYFIAIFDILIYLFSVIIILSKRVSYSTKNYYLSFLFYIIGVVLLVALGKIAAGYSWLFSFPIIAGILKGLKTGIHALIINAFTFIIVGFFLIYLKLFPALPIVEYNIIAWVTIAVNFILLNTIITIVNGIILRGLILSMNEQDKLSSNLSIKGEQLLKANIKLREEVKQRIHVEAELREAISKAEAASIAKSEFLANISHEIRTPLNAIIGFSEILSESEISLENIEYMKSLKCAGFDLLNLINKILDISKIESDELVIKYDIVDIEKLFFEIKSIYMHQIMEKGIEPFFEINTNNIYFIIIDEVRLKQILINVLDNAIKFTEKGFIKVKFEINKNTSIDSADLKISVEDTGIGIHEEDFENIFDTFWQKDGKATRQYEGTGIGLALVRKLVNLMNGEINLESVVEEGSKFSITYKNLQIPNEDSLNYANITKSQNHLYENAQLHESTKSFAPDSDFVSGLHSKFLPQIKYLQENMILEDIHDFGQRLQKFADEHNNHQLKTYAKDLVFSSMMYKLDKIQTIFQNISDYSQNQL